MIVDTGTAPSTAAAPSAAAVSEVTRARPRPGPDRQVRSYTVHAGITHATERKLDNEARRQHLSPSRVVVAYLFLQTYYNCCCGFGHAQQSSLFVPTAPAGQHLVHASSYINSLGSRVACVAATMFGHTIRDPSICTLGEGRLAHI